MICDCNWDEIKAEYIAGGITHAELAKKHGVSISSLQKKAASEKWKSEKKKISEKVAKKVSEKVADRKADEIVEAISTVRYTTMLWSDTLAAVTNLLKMTPEYVVSSPAFLSGVAGSLEKTYELLLKMAGKSDSQKKMQIDLDRLKLDQKRFEAEQEEKKAAAHIAESLSEVWKIELDTDEVKLDE